MDFSLSNNSAVYAVLSPVKNTPLDMGNKLSPMNNSFHPTLSIQGASELAEAVELMRHNLGQLVPLREILQKNDIEVSQFSLALNLLHSYTYIIDETLTLEKNKRFANLAYSQKKSVK